MPAGRRARLTISRIDPWTVLRFSLLLYVCFYLILMVAGFALWTAGTITGLRDNVESFVGDLISSPNFKFLGGRILEASALGGAVMVAVGAGANVLMAVLYNLISDVVGGVGVTLEEPPAGADRIEPASTTAKPARRWTRDGRAPKTVPGKPEAADGEAPKEQPAATHRSDDDSEPAPADATPTDAKAVDRPGPAGPSESEATPISTA